MRIFWFKTLTWKKICCSTYLKYGPCRPKLAWLGVKIPKRKRVLVSKTESENVPKNEFKVALRPDRNKSWNSTPVFSFFDPAKPRVFPHFGVQRWVLEESVPSATAPYGVQLLINWMLRFHVGHPREFHHLRLRRVQWRHQRVRCNEQGAQGPRIGFPGVKKLWSASW